MRLTRGATSTITQRAHTEAGRHDRMQRRPHRGRVTGVVVRGVGLAHMDAALKANEGAAQLLRGDLKALLAARGVDVSVH